MDNQDIFSLLKNVTDLQYIDIEKMPDINLYMDQVVTFIEDNLKQHKRDEKQKIITKTMVNNYTKDKILSPPTKKKYNKNHLIALVLIYHLKSILSINDIALLLKEEDENIEDIYTQFLKNKALDDDVFYNQTFEKIQEKNKDIDKKELLLLILSLIDEANKRKMLVEKIIDVYFKK